jgi:hypothetical protein
MLQYSLSDDLLSCRIGPRGLAELSQCRMRVAYLAAERYDKSCMGQGNKVRREQQQQQRRKSGALPPKGLQGAPAAKSRAPGVSVCVSWMVTSS